jgi:hypothetical protein
LDLRDNRGKRHELTVVLIGGAIAVLSNREGNLSALQRHLTKRYKQLMEVLGLPVGRAVSRSQLPVILEKVAVDVFDDLLFESYGIQLSSMLPQSSLPLMAKNFAEALKKKQREAKR